MYLGMSPGVLEGAHASGPRPQREYTPMNTRPWLLVLGVALLVASRPNAAPRVELHVDLDERVNAVYHLACLARNISCTTDTFESFWKDRLTGGDGKAPA